ncbi:WhiB family transcriptional regulator [Verrucosispora sp. NA02020]|uniref:WhiB family transcriptional regulator n=1 Tax=Verrucosispora sp. NA02020 TaxID=2742132 RepID=UPI00158FBD44|nr:WhiB family transcriptional regulator [Verrucosispora sp. NA02020]QKW15338.1 WhiB family transcriptional regulator [Verrucosispora sp. NA02020]
MSRLNFTVDRRSSDHGDRWRDNSICRDMDGELFFPVGTGPSARNQTEQAKAVCRRCPVQLACLNWALESGEQFGVAGGMSEDERQALLRRGIRSVATA